MKKQVLVITLIGLLLTVTITSQIFSSINHENDSIAPFEFNDTLDLTNNESTRNAIGFYMINRENESKDTFQVLTPDTWNEMNLTVRLGPIKDSSEVNVIRTYTNMTGQVRKFSSEIRYSPYHWEEIHGWIDRRKDVYESHGSKFIADPAVYSDPGTPDAQAREIMINAVGEEYFLKHFLQWKTEINTHEPENWYTAIGYLYYLRVDDYTARREISIYFNQQNELIRTHGTPKKGNLMPFFVSNEDAILIAKSHNEKSYEEVGAEIYYVDETPYDVLLDRYVWVIYFYHNPKNARSGTMTVVYVDPNTKEVYGSCEIGWSRTP